MEDRVQKYFADPRKIKEVRPLEDHSLLLTLIMEKKGNIAWNMS